MAVRLASLHVEQRRQEEIGGDDFGGAANGDQPPVAAMDAKVHAPQSARQHKDHRSGQDAAQKQHLEQRKLGAYRLCGHVIERKTQH